MENYQKQLKSLPPAYRFQPCDEVLIDYYLKRRVQGAPSDVVSEANVYNVEPWNLPGADALDGGVEALYFLTKRRKRYARGRRVNRKAGDGYWRVVDTEKPILNSARNVIGYKRDLVYRSLGPSSGDKNWLMNEYRLSEQSSAHEDTVLCKITRSKWGSKGRKDKEYEAEKIVKATRDDDYSGLQQNVGGELSPSLVSGLIYEDTTLSISDIPITMDQSMLVSSPGSMAGYSGYHQMPQQSGPMDGYSGLMNEDAMLSTSDIPITMDQSMSDSFPESMGGYSGYHQMSQQSGSMDGYSGLMNEDAMLSTWDIPTTMDQSMSESFPVSMGGYSGYHHMPQQSGSMDGHYGHHQMPQQSKSMDGYSGHHHGWLF